MSTVTSPSHPLLSRLGVWNPSQIIARYTMPSCKGRKACSSSANLCTLVHWSSTLYHYTWPLFLHRIPLFTICCQIWLLCNTSVIECGMGNQLLPSICVEGWVGQPVRCTCLRFCVNVRARELRRQSLFLANPHPAPLIMIVTITMCNNINCNGRTQEHIIMYDGIPKERNKYAITCVHTHMGKP